VKEGFFPASEVPVTDLSDRSATGAAADRAVPGRIRSGALQLVIAGGLAVRRAQGDPIARLAGPAGRRDPYPAYRKIREDGPVVPSMIGWITANHAISTAVLRDHDTFGSASIPDAPRRVDLVSRMLARLRSGESTASMQGRRFTSEDLFQAVPDPLGEESMIGMDPPDHTRLRRLVSRAFTPRAIQRVRDRVEEVAAGLLDEAPRDQFELMSGYAGMLPVVVISELLGIPPRDWERVKQWGDVLASGLDVMGGAPDHVVDPALSSLGLYLDDLFERRRRAPGDRVIDTLIAGSQTEGGLTDRELMATAILLLIAGFETTVNLIGNGVLTMLRHPAELARFRQDPTLAANLVEEVLRYEPSVQMTARMVRRDTDLGGRRLHRGALLIVALGGANRDPAVFADPDRFDITRANAREHLSFAAGIHHCLGAALARLEGEVALRALFERYPDLGLNGTVRRGRGLILRGPSRLPVRLGAPA
jgi:cytochrome P450